MSSSIAAELAFWRGSESRSALHFTTSLARIEPSFRSDATVSTLLDSLASGEAEAALARAWLGPGPRASDGYPVPRFVALLDSLSAVIVGILLSGARRGGAWHMQRAAISDIARAASEWCMLLARLGAGDAFAAALRRNDGDDDSGRAAQSPPSRPWQGQPPIAPAVEAIGARAERIVLFRRLANELSALVFGEGAFGAAAGADKSGAGTIPAVVSSGAGPSASLASALLPVLSLVNPLDVDATAWQTAEDEVAHSLIPLENVAAEALAAAVSSAGDSPASLLVVLRDFSLLRVRVAAHPRVAAAVEVALARANASLSDLEATPAASAPLAACATLSGSATSPSVHDVSPLVSSARTVVMLRAKALVIKAVGDAAGGQAGKALSVAAEDAATALARRARDLVAAWASRLNAGPPHGALLAFDAAGNVESTFSEGAARLLRDARALASAHLPLPPSAETAVRDAARLYRHAVALQRVGSYYNALGADVGPTAKPLLLGPLLSFEQTVARARRSDAPTWTGDERAVDVFVTELRGRANDLAGASKTLRKSAGAAADAVAVLARADASREGGVALRNAWDKFRVAVTRGTRGAAPDAAATWTEHWDAQGAKAVRVALAASLEVLRSSIPEVRAEISLSTEGLPVLLPSLEVLRCSHAATLRVIVALPSSLEPTSNAAPRAAARSRARLSAAVPLAAPALYRSYFDAEIVWARAARELDGWRTRTAIARVPTVREDPEAFVTQNVQTPAAFSAALAAVSSRRDALAKAPDVVRIEWLAISTAPIKSACDAALSSIALALGACLRRDIFSNTSVIEAAASRASALLDAPLTASREAVAAAAREWRAIEGEAARVSAVYAAAASRVAVAASAGGSLADDAAEASTRLARAQESWNDAKKRLETFGEKLEAARGSLAGRFNADVLEHNARVERAASRWAGLKPSGSELQDGSGVEDDTVAGGGVIAAAVASAERVIAETRESLALLRAASSAIIESADAFGIKAPSTATLDALEVDVNSTACAWDAAALYSNERKALCAHDWLSYRSKSGELTQWAASWESDLTRSRGNVDAGGLTAGAPRSMAPPSDTSVDSTDTQQESELPSSALPQILLVAAAPSSAPAPVATPPTLTPRKIALAGAPVSHAVLQWLSADVSAIRRAGPSLKLLRGDAFRDDHWTAAFKRIGLARTVTPSNLLVQNLLQRTTLAALPPALPFLRELAARAAGEVAIRQGLADVRAWADTAEWPLREHTSPVDPTVRVSLVRDFSAPLAALSDTAALLSSLKDSVFFRPFADAAARLESNFAVVDAAATLLAAVQRRWLYLEPVFARGSLPAEAPRFRRADTELRSLLSRLAADPRVMALADASTFPNVVATLQNVADALERAQRALADLLEAKRHRCARFFFLGDDALLELLGQGTAAPIVQAHAPKLFPGAASLILSPPSGGDGAHILALESSGGERLLLSPPVTLVADVCTWVDALASAAAAALADATAKAVASLGRELNATPLVGRFPCQALALAQSLRFVADAEAALASGGGAALSKLSERVAAALAALSARGAELGIAAGAQAALESATIKALVLELIHWEDVLNTLTLEKATSPRAWTWQRTLRFYDAQAASAPIPSGWPRAPDDRSLRVVASLAAATVECSWEYQGVQPRLVHTPLTDKCFTVLTQALALGLGGNPYGPAGTGKTESVKALGAALGRLVLVFNCDEGIDFASMGRILTGVVLTGAWGCFDEFNRLRPEQLSAISAQVASIQDALRTRAPSMAMPGDDRMTALRVHPGAAVFVTLNPAGKGYGGRSALPENLMALFRPVAMTAPEVSLIAAAALRSDGFVDSASLGARVAALFSGSAALLSPAQHYDWGLRAIKACLSTAGVAAARERASSGAALSTAREASLLVAAVRSNTVSKLAGVDGDAFTALLGDAFPGVPQTDVADAALETSLHALAAAVKGSPAATAATAAGLVLGSVVVNAALSRSLALLRGALNERTGCVIVGPPRAGKSTLWRALHAALLIAGEQLRVFALHPKAMPRAALLGRLDADSREWTDGVLTAAARAAAGFTASTPGARAWIVCDGDVDPEWIEALNSVLDDNKLLTLASGERISLGSRVNFLFETHDLRFASPATVSRCGMVFLDAPDGAVAAERVLASAARSNGKAIDAPVDPALASLSRGALAALATVSSADALALGAAGSPPVSLFSGALSAVTIAAEKKASADDTARAFARAFAAPFSSASVKRVITSAILDAVGVTAGAGEVEFLPTEDGVCGDVPLTDALRAETAAAAGDNVAPHPTAALLRTTAVLRSWLARREPVLLTGPPGCGKAVAVEAVIAAARRSQTARAPFAVATVFCTASTDADAVVAALRSACVSAASGAGRVLRPRDADALILFIRNVDLPAADVWGSVPLQSFLFSLLTLHGFYDETRDFVGIERVTIVMSAAPVPGGGAGVGRAIIHPRLAAAVHILSVPSPEPAELASIADALLMRTIMRAAPVADSRFDGAAAVKNTATLARTIVDVWSATALAIARGDVRAAVPPSPHDVRAIVGALKLYALGGEPSLTTVAEAETTARLRSRLSDSLSRARFDALASPIWRSAWGAAPTTAQSGNFFAALGNGAGNADAGAPLRHVDKRDFASALGAALEAASADDASASARPAFVLHESALEVSRALDRALGCGGAPLVLLGAPGCGRRTLAGALASAHGLTLVSPPAPRPGAPPGAAWRSIAGELRTAFSKAAAGDATAIYFECSAVVTPSLFSALDAFAATGFFPADVVPVDETDTLAAGLLETAADEGVTPLALLATRSRAHIRIVVSLDQRARSTRERLSRFPALSTHAALAVAPIWSDGDAAALALSLVRGWEDDAGASAPPPASRDAATADLAKLAQLVWSFPIDESTATASALPPPPLALISLLRTFRALLKGAFSEGAAETATLRAGVGKLAEAAASVDVLATDAATAKAGLTTAQAAADTAMSAITDALSAAADTRRDAAALAVRAREAESITRTRASAIATEMAGIAPVLEAARAAVNGIQRDNLEEIRSLKAPPPAIADVLGGVLMLLGTDDTSWLSMKKFLGGRGVISEIIAFDAGRVARATREGVAKVLKDKAESFKPEVITRASTAAAPLAAWVKAVIAYAEVAERVEPLSRELADAKAALAAASGELAGANAELAKVDARVAELKTAFGARTAEAARLSEKLARIEDTLSRARALLSALGDERSRWSTRLAALAADAAALPRRILLSSAWLERLGGADESVRARVGAAWMRAAALDTFSLSATLATESTLAGWRASGLPGDDLSAENGALVTAAVAAARTPLVIDPVGAASAWLRVHLSRAAAAASVALEVVGAGDARVANAVELAARFGKMLLLTGAPTDAAGAAWLLPLLRRATTVDGSGRALVSLGDRTVELAPAFRAVWVTATAPSAGGLPPALSCLVTPINFTVTRSGLQGQLLAASVDAVAPALERRARALLTTEESLRAERADAEARVLAALSASTGSLLDDAVLVATLAESQVRAREAADALASARAARNALHAKREGFAPLAAAGARLFFCVRALPVLSPVYETGLTAFVNSFRSVLGGSDGGDSDADAATGRDDPDAAARNAARVAAAIPALARRVIASVLRATRKVHHTTIALALVRALAPDSFRVGDVADAYPALSELTSFVGDSSVDGGSAGAGGGVKGGGAATAAPIWLHPSRAAALRSLVAAVPAFARAVADDADGWGKWSVSASPEAAAAAPRALTALGPWARALAVVAVRPERSAAALAAFSGEIVGSGSGALQPASAALAALASEAVAATPIVLLCAPGADASRELALVAGSAARGDYTEIPLSSSAVDAALDAVKNAAARGAWILLSNLHLVPLALSRVDATLRAMLADPDAPPHPSARIWLAGEISPAWPAPLLQASLVAVLEAPSGLRANIARSLTSVPAGWWTDAPPHRATLRAAAAWLHGVVQERANFAPQGWRTRVNFANADLAAGVGAVEAATRGTPNSAPDWPTLWGLFETSVYGGRLDNDRDSLLLRALVRSVMTAEVTAGARALGAAHGPRLPTPQTNDAAKIESALLAIPQATQPSLLGLPDNVHRSVARAGESYRPLALFFSGSEVTPRCPFSPHLNHQTCPIWAQRSALSRLHPL